MHEPIETQRLMLHPLSEADVVDFAKYANDWDICRMTGTFPFPFPRVSVEGMIDMFLARAVTGRDYHWVIRYQGAFCGIVGIHRQDQAWSLGYWLAKPVWGQGFAKEGIAAVLNHLDMTLGTYRMTAGVFMDNPASVHILRVSGFRQIGSVDKAYSLARRGMADLLKFERVRTRQDRPTPSRTAVTALKAHHEVS